MVMQSHCLVNAVALPPRTPGSNGCKWVCFWSWRRTWVRLPKRELKWRRKADEVEQPFRSPIRAKNMVDRPRPKGVPAGFSIEFAMVRSSPQRFDSVLSIVVWCGVLPHHHSQNPDSYQLGFFLPAPPVLARFQALSSSAALRLEPGFLRPEPRFLSLFSAGLLSVQCIRPRKIKGSQWSGCENKALPVTDLSDEIAAARHRLRTRVLRMATGILAPSAVNLTPQALLYTIAVY